MQGRSVAVCHCCAIIRVHKPIQTGEADHANRVQTMPNLRFWLLLGTSGKYTFSICVFSRVFCSRSGGCYVHKYKKLHRRFTTVLPLSARTPVLPKHAFPSALSSSTSSSSLPFFSSVGLLLFWEGEGGREVPEQLVRLPLHVKSSLSPSSPPTAFTRMESMCPPGYTDARAYPLSPLRQSNSLYSFQAQSRQTTRGR